MIFYLQFVRENREILFRISSIILFLFTWTFWIPKINYYLFFHDIAYILQVPMYITQKLVTQWSRSLEKTIDENNICIRFLVLGMTMCLLHFGIWPVVAENGMRIYCGSKSSPLSDHLYRGYMYIYPWIPSTSKKQEPRRKGRALNSNVPVLLTETRQSTNIRGRENSDVTDSLLVKY